MAKTHRLQVSAHGKAFGGRYFIPPKWTLDFFVKMGEVLPYPQSIEIYEQFRKHDWDALEKQVVHKYFGDAEVSDYALWDLGDKNYVSGVLLATDIGVETIINLSGSTEQNPLLLSAALGLAMNKLRFAKEDDVIVYFNACRS